MNRTYPAESYTRGEVMALLEACGDSAVGLRNRALIAVMWRAGLRLAEALALQTRDVDWEHGTIRVLHGKGDKARTVGIDQGGLAVLKEWRDARTPIEARSPSAPFFCTMQGHQLWQSYVRAMLPRLASRAGVGRRVHAHGFRHTFAVELAREGVPMIHIQRLLGHSSLATTSIYLASLSPEEALAAVRGREW